MQGKKLAYLKRSSQHADSSVYIVILIAFGIILTASLTCNANFLELLRMIFATIIRLTLKTKQNTNADPHVITEPTCFNRLISIVYRGFSVSLFLRRWPNPTVYLYSLNALNTLLVAAPIEKATFRLMADVAVWVIVQESLIRIYKCIFYPYGTYFWQVFSADIVQNILVGDLRSYWRNETLHSNMWRT